MTTTLNMPIALTGGLVYLLLALTMWRMLRAIPQATVVRRWSLGSVLSGIALLLVASRSQLPVWVGNELMGALSVGGILMQTAALRLYLGRMPAVAPPVLAVLALGGALSVALYLAGQRAALFVAVCLLLALLSGTLAWHARLTARHARSRSASLMAWSYAVLTAGLLARALSVVAGAPFRPTEGGVAFVVLHAAAVLAALYGSLGFMGLMLDITRRAEAVARESQVAEVTRRQAAEQAADALRSLLAQRDALSMERERLLQLLALAFRQPLHNASGALQAASQALGAGPTTAANTAAAQRLGRAETVLGDMRSVLDNTLAAAALLTRKPPVLLQELELAFLVELVLGDLDPLDRQRVDLQWHTDLRQVEVEPGLMRLALRNLLLNAFRHGGPGVHVLLRMAEQAQPPALLLQVIDNGPGLAAGGAAVPEPGRGLGLQIVRQVMVLHGGSLQLQAVQPQGLTASLVLPLPLPVD